MTTPQYIPPEFQDELEGLDPAPINEAELAQSKADRDKYARWLAAQNAALKSMEAKEKASKNKAKDAWYREQQTKIRGEISATEAKRVAAQNKIYQLGREYDRLLEGPNRDAYQALLSMFTEMGLGSLAGKIFNYVKEGYGADTVSLLLQDTPEYKERFAGNEARKKAGLVVLSPAEYLSVERSYRQILQDAGMPKGFYDSPADFRNWIAGDVSPTELKGRVDLAAANTAAANNNTKRAMDMLYGINDSHLTAYFFDRTRGLPLLEKQAKAAQFGAEALKRNLALDRQNLEDYATAGLSLSTVSQGFQQVAESLPALQAIADRFGETFTQREAEKDFIEGGVTGYPSEPRFMNENPTAKRKRLASQERAMFSGRQGSSTAGLSAGYRAT